jgi:hypothetical protein
MLRQASVSDLISDRVSRETGYVVITMRRYPRFVNRLLRDEYLSCMSPELELFEDWLSAKRRHQDHDRAFARSRFEERFDVGDEGLLVLARAVFRARAERPEHEYPLFEKRLDSFRARARALSRRH